MARQTPFRVEGWEPATYDGPVVCLAGSEPRQGYYAAPLMGWAELLTGQTACHLVEDGLQGLMREPAARKVAEVMRREMEVIL